SRGSSIGLIEDVIHFRYIQHRPHFGGDNLLSGRGSNDRAVTSLRRPRAAIALPVGPIHAFATLVAYQEPAEQVGGRPPALRLARVADLGTQHLKGGPVDDGFPVAHAHHLASVDSEPGQAGRGEQAAENASLPLGCSRRLDASLVQ